MNEEIKLTFGIIRKIGNKWRLYSHTGKNLGTFDSLEAAKKHEREVQYFKHATLDFAEKWDKLNPSV